MLDTAIVKGVGVVVESKKLPFVSVIVPITFPFTAILTPISDSFEAPSLTLPEIFVCANDDAASNMIEAKKLSLILVKKFFIK